MHAVVYTDANFVKYAAMSLYTLLKTQSIDRLTVLHPSLVDADESMEGQTLVQLLEYLRMLDSRVETLWVGDVYAPNGQGEELAASHPELYTDIVRSYLYKQFGSPVVWLDVDMLFLRDIAGELVDIDAPIGAVDDIASNLGDLRGLRGFRAFEQYLHSNSDYASPASFPINCGLLALNEDISEEFATGLRLANEFAEGYDGPVEVSDIVRHARGQLAWAYVFETVGGARLPHRLNRIPRHEPIIGPSGGLAEEDTSVIHYIGGSKSSRMSVDFVSLLQAGVFSER